MRTLATNSNNDIYLTAGKSIAVASDQAAVLDMCKLAAGAMVGELVFDQLGGMNNFSTIWAGNASVRLAAWQARLRTVLLGVAGVTGLIDLTATISDGVVSYSVTINTEWGSGVVNG